jgi:hypothetical protein
MPWSETVFPTLQGLVEGSGLVKGQVFAPWHHHRVPGVRVSFDSPDDRDTAPIRLPATALKLNDVFTAGLNQLFRHFRYHFGSLEIIVLHGLIDELRLMVKVRPSEHLLLMPLVSPVE